MNDQSPFFGLVKTRLGHKINETKGLENRLYAELNEEPNKK